MDFNKEEVTEFKKTIENIVDSRINNKGITNYVSAKVVHINEDNSVDVIIPPDETKRVTRLLNKTNEVLNVGDSVELCTKNGKLSNCWVALKHGTSVSPVGDKTIYGNLNVEGNLYAANMGYGTLPEHTNIDDIITTKQVMIFNASGTLPDDYSIYDNNIILESTMWGTDVNNYGRQVLKDIRSNKTYQRNRNAGQWGKWELIATNKGRIENISFNALAYHGTGLYDILSNGDAPYSSDAWYHVMQIVADPNVWAYQETTCWWGSKFIRKMENGTWGAWERVITSNNIEIGKVPLNHFEKFDFGTVDKRLRYRLKFKKTYSSPPLVFCFESDMSATTFYGELRFYVKEVHNDYCYIVAPFEEFYDITCGYVVIGDM